MSCLTTSSFSTPTSSSQPLNIGTSVTSDSPIDNFITDIISVSIQVFFIYGVFYTQKYLIQIIKLLSHNTVIMESLLKC